MKKIKISEYVILNETEIWVIGVWNKPFLDVNLVSTKIFSELPEGFISVNGLECIKSILPFKQMQLYFHFSYILSWKCFL